MALTAEVVNTTFSDLRGPLQVSFVRRDPLWAAMDDNCRITQSTGSNIERSFTAGAPARGVGIYNGDELLNMTRRQQTRRYIVEHHRMVVAINIPKKELNYNKGPNAVISLIKEYPQAVVMGAKTDINSYLLTGVSRGIVFQTAELRGLLTLNGQVTTGLGTGVANGLLDFAATTAQTDPVQSVAKAAATFHFNQYGDIGAWAASGMRTWRTVYRQCASYADDNQGPDIMVCDPDTYANFEETRLSNVQVNIVEAKTEKSNLLSLDFGLGRIYHDLSLDRSLFTAPAADGVLYMLNTNYLEMPTLVSPTVSKFTERVGDQDCITAIFEAQFNTIALRTPVHGCVSGGAL